MTSNLAGIWQRLPNEPSYVKSRSPPRLKWSAAQEKQGASDSSSSSHSSPAPEFSGSPRSSIGSSISPTPPSSASPSHPTISLPSGLVDQLHSPARRSPKSLFPDNGNGFSGLAFLAGREKDFGVASFGSSVAGAPSPPLQPVSTPTPTSPAAVEAPLSTEPSRDHTQLALAEIFAGNPRPHFRSPAQSQPSLPPVGVELPDASRSYFSPPAASSQAPPGRVRSQSSAPVLDRVAISSQSMNSSSNPSFNGSSSQGRSSSHHGDQHGYRPSLPSYYSSSLPSDIPNGIRIGSSATSALGESSFRNDQSPPPSSRLGTIGSASYAGAGDYDNVTGWRPAAGQRTHSFGGAWEDEQREGRAVARDGPWGERDASVSSTGTGIGLSNMSPFTRDGSRTLAELADGAYKTRREYSLGAVGTGRKRGESVWGSSRPLREAEDEDAEDTFAPTRSGATSRRHSFAAFNPPSRSQIGFTVPDDGGAKLSTSAASNSNGFGSIGRRGFGMGNSAIDDDDLAADLNSLHLNLEAHAAGQNSQSQSFAPVGSMPINYPQSRPYDTTAKSTPVTNSQAFSPPPSQSEIFSPPLAGNASRFFQPAVSTGRSTSRFEFGGASTPSSPAGLPTNQLSDFGQNAFRSTPSHQQQQQQPLQQQMEARFHPSYGLPPPSPPNSSFYPSSGAQLSSHGLGGLSAQAPPFQTFSPSPLPTPSGNNSGMQSPFFPPTPTSAGPPHLGQAQNQDLANLGRGIPLHTVPAHAPLYIVEFKAGRKDLFFVEDPNLQLRQGDLVIVEADRGKDIGKYFKPCSLDEVQAFQQRLVEMALGQLANPGTGNVPPNSTAIARMTKEFAPKKIFGKAQASDTQMLLSKAQDEVKALALIRSKVQQKNLAMEVQDAEWQWDRRKLTFYFTLLPGHARVDFRELVRELFRIYKTRLWLCSLDQQASTWDFGPSH